MLSATQLNPVMKEFYNRLISQDNDKNEAITACMHEMMTILNTLVGNDQVWKLT